MSNLIQPYIIENILPYVDFIFDLYGTVPHHTAKYTNISFKKIDVRNSNYIKYRIIEMLLSADNNS